MQRKTSLSLFLILWYVMIGWASMGDMNWLMRGIIIAASLPMLLFALYLIWFDSRKPFNQQFKFDNSRWGKK